MVTKNKEPTESQFRLTRLNFDNFSTQTYSLKKDLVSDYDAR